MAARHFVPPQVSCLAIQVVTNFIGLISGVSRILADFSTLFAMMALF